MGRGATQGTAEEAKTHQASPIATTRTIKATTTVLTTTRLAMVAITVAASNSIREVEAAMLSIIITRTAITIINNKIVAITSKAVARVVTVATIRGATLLLAQP